MRGVLFERISGKYSSICAKRRSRRFKSKLNYQADFFAQRLGNKGSGVQFFSAQIAFKVDQQSTRDEGVEFQLGFAEQLFGETSEQVELSGEGFAKRET